MKTAKRLLSFLLAVLLLSGCCFAFARSAGDYSGYRQYVSLGDSIADGIGENNVENKYMHRTPGAYPDRIANELGAELTQLGCGGMRTVELRACLESDYVMPDEYANNFNREVVKSIRGRFAPAISNADIITLNIGSNDVATYALLRAKSASSALGVAIDSKVAELEAEGEYTGALVTLLNAVKTVDRYGSIVSEAISGLTEGYLRFCENWDAIIGDIYALNPDVTLLVAGFYNPFDHLKISDDSLLELGKAADGIMELMSLKISSGSPYSSRYIYVDIMGVESMAAKYGDSLTDEGFFQAVELNVHPSNEGQADIAERFIRLIPEKSGAPFTDIAAKPLDYRNAIDWAYAQGITAGRSETTFAPDETCSRGQIVTMLWRAAGSPAAKSGCGFADVAPGSYCYDAVCWGSEKGIVMGFSDAEFRPDAVCTRGQIVSFLYRYAGSPAVKGSVSFADVTPDSYCHDAVLWAVENGIARGFDSSRFAPDGLCTRAQAVTFIYRYMA
ncbi:MAG: S-layer homology domain-containing protein [Oscillospiraceae bacterium]|nr:S-layer homology domain-containing protein [Oscillospiraceae bacterium]